MSGCSVRRKLRGYWQPAALSGPVKRREGEMKRLLMIGGLGALLSCGGHPAYAVTDITVANLGSILDASVSFPSNHTPGSGVPFMFYFEFSLPVVESVTLSMSDSATGTQRITGGDLSLNGWTMTGTLTNSGLQIPVGPTIDQVSIVDLTGGQVATTGPRTGLVRDFITVWCGVSVAVRR